MTSPLSAAQAIRMQETESRMRKDADDQNVNALVNKRVEWEEVIRWCYSGKNDKAEWGDRQRNVEETVFDADGRSQSAEKCQRAPRSNLFVMKVSTIIYYLNAILYIDVLL